MYKISETSKPSAAVARGRIIDYRVLSFISAPLRWRSRLCLSAAPAERVYSARAWWERYFGLLRARARAAPFVRILIVRKSEKNIRSTTFRSLSLARDNGRIDFFIARYLGVLPIKLSGSFNGKQWFLLILWDLMVFFLFPFFLSFFFSNWFAKFLKFYG